MVWIPFYTSLKNEAFPFHMLQVNIHYIKTDFHVEVSVTGQIQNAET